jgi:hypothetical protein
MWHKGVRACLAMVALIGSGCATTATKSAFLSETSRLHPGRFLQNYWSAPELTSQACSKIYIEPIDTSRITNQRGVSVVDIADWLATGVALAIHQNSGWNTVDRAEESTSKLEMAVTSYTPGSSTGRALVGGLGVGRAAVQVEGRLVDSATNKELACFTDRQTDTGTGGLDDLGGDAGPELIERMLEHVGAILMMELSADRHDDAK